MCFIAALWISLRVQLSGLVPNTVGVVLLGLGRFYDGYCVRSGCPGCVLLCAAGRGYLVFTSKFSCFNEFEDLGYVREHCPWCV